MRAILEDIENLLGPGNLMTDHASRVAYAHAVDYAGVAPDGILPLAVARPTHFGKLARLLQLCSNHRLPLVFRGNGCAVRALSVPMLADSLVVISTGLNRIYDVDAASCTVRVQPGATCAAVAAAAATAGLRFPALPLAPGPLTVGGLLSVNEADAWYPAYGAPAAYAVSLDVYATDGRKIICSGAAGLSGGMGARLPLPQLFCGACGSLGFMGEAVLRLVPLPRRTDKFLWHFGSAAEVLAAAGRCLESAFGLPMALKIFDPFCTAILAPGLGSEAWLLYAECLDAPDDLAEMLERGHTPWQKICVSKRDFSAALACLLPGLARENGPFVLERLACAPADLPVLLENVRACLARFAVKGAISCLPGLARVDVALFLNGQDIGQLRKDLFAMELMVNQRMEKEDDALMARTEWQRAHMGIGDELMAALKRICDPQGLLDGQAGGEYARRT